MGEVPAPLRGAQYAARPLQLYIFLDVEPEGVPPPTRFWSRNRLAHIVNIVEAHFSALTLMGMTIMRTLAAGVRLQVRRSLL